jgi:beta-galactosidase
LAYVTLRIEDKNGNLCPMANKLVNFEVNGAGELMAVDNGNAATTEPFQANYRKAFSGMCLVVLKSTKENGEIKLKATSKKLNSAEICVTTK